MSGVLMGCDILASQESPHDKTQRNRNQRRQIHAGVQMSAPKTKAELSAAAEWLADNWSEALKQPLSIVLKERFGIVRPDSHKVIGEAVHIRKLRQGR